MLEVRTEAPGLLVMADTWLPGWSALVDGRPAPIFLGNQAQRVIPLEQPGRHTIILQYSPPGLPLGGFITATSGLVWALVGSLVFKKNWQPGKNNRVWVSPSSGVFIGDSNRSSTEATELPIEGRARSLE